MLFVFSAHKKFSLTAPITLVYTLFWSTKMQRFYIYLTDEQQKRIEQTAQITNKPKSEVVREALDKGLVRSKKSGSVSAEALLEFAKQAEAIPMVGQVPDDFVKNMDHYTWGGS